MIGNDIVDLQWAAQESDPLRPRFLNKVFTLQEQEGISNSCSPINHVWLLWTMKESTYKAHQRRFSHPRNFDPLIIECRLSNQTSNTAGGEGKIDDHIYNLSSILTKEYIHSTASEISLTSKTKWEIFSTPIDLKRHLLLHISKQLKLELDDLVLEKDGNFIPSIIYQKSRIPLHFSLSQHGKFSAYSVELTNY